MLRIYENDTMRFYHYFITLIDMMRDDVNLYDVYIWTHPITWYLLSYYTITAFISCGFDNDIYIHIFLWAFLIEKWCIAVHICHQQYYLVLRQIGYHQVRRMSTWISTARVMTNSQYSTIWLVACHDFHLMWWELLLRTSLTYSNRYHCMTCALAILMLTARSHQHYSYDSLTSMCRWFRYNTLVH